MISEPVSGTASNPDADGVNAPELQAFVMALFFIFGGITSLNDVLIPKLKELFTLSYLQAMLVQSAFFFAYFVLSVPGGMLVRRIGYMRGAVVGLLTMMAGCLLFVPASASATFGVFLLALFVLASGITIVQVVANPLISLLGAARTAHSRLTFAQAFNSLGTTIFPYVGSLVILGNLAAVNAADLSGPSLAAYRVQETRAVVHAYLGLAGALAIVALAVWMARKRLVEGRHDDVSLRSSLALLREKRFAFGMLSLFLYVGSEVAIGSLIVSYLRQDHVLGLDDRTAGTLIPLYWGGALIGRFVGSAILRKFAPGKVLAFNATGAILLLALSMTMAGAVAGYSLLAIGLMNSIMFPTIFSLASEDLGKRAAEGSGLICVAIVGGAVIPPLTGQIADASGSLATALLLPLGCYLAIGGFGLWAVRQRR